MNNKIINNLITTSNYMTGNELINICFIISKQYFMKIISELEENNTTKQNIFIFREVVSFPRTFYN